MTTYQPGGNWPNPFVLWLPEPANPPPSAGPLGCLTTPPPFPPVFNDPFPGTPLAAGSGVRPLDTGGVRLVGVGVGIGELDLLPLPLVSPNILSLASRYSSSFSAYVFPCADCTTFSGFELGAGWRRRILIWGVGSCWVWANVICGGGGFEFLGH